MGLADLRFDLEYRNFKKDVIKEFYEPALSRAISYKRAVGFFSSTSLIDISYGLSSLVNNGGEIQLVVSPRLSEEDMEAIKTGYEKREEIVGRVLLKDWEEPQSIFQKKRLNMLANYIAMGKLDIKIAFVHGMQENVVGIFHEKLGLISDGVNTVAFSGSLNETNTGFYYNYETIDVYCDWMSAESRERVETKKRAFETIWNNQENNMEVLDFPAVLKEKIETYHVDNVIDVNIDEEEMHEAKQSVVFEKSMPYIPPDFEIREYQKNAVDMWEEKGFRGIFDMATGTGKTYTALLGIQRAFEKNQGRLAVIIACPYQHLVEQWVEDLKYFGMDPIVAYSTSGNKKYKLDIKNAVFDYNLGVKKFFCFICTNATYQLDSIQKEVEKLRENVLLVVDEAHNFGAKKLQIKLLPQFEFRLALSATLERYRDEEGTEMLLNYFGEKCISYSLEMAIEDKMLTPYKYIPVSVCLTESELEAYKRLTEEIGKCLKINKNGKPELNRKGQILALRRARIVAGAYEKIDKLCEIMAEYKNDSHMLVYCGATRIAEDLEETDVDVEGERQIDCITHRLGNELDMRVAQFTSREDKEQRELRIRHFRDGDLQGLIAIKCLDEGVNIPNIRTAFILASTTNPKEYIQRRGRVLRLAKEKEMAVIYDFVTLPRSMDEAYVLTDEQKQGEKTLVLNEIARMQEFKRLALNPNESDLIINELIEIYSLYDSVEIV